MIFIWSIRIFVNILAYIHLWYIKEYRFDRMLIHLQTKQGRNILFPSFRRPPITPKTIVLCLGTITVLYLVYTLIPGSTVLKLLVTDIMTFPVLSLLVLLTKIPTRIYHQIVIRKAVNLLRAHKSMNVIGITGSYGKTSTKEILYTLLSKKYKTIKTEASKNSPIAIAELVLARLRQDTEVFIVEMGAYKKGEIREMCAMVQPQIGIVTAINPQHQDLFGSIENTVAAKFELLEGLTGKRIAIVNGDDTRVAGMGKKAKELGCKIVEYSKKDVPVTQQAKGIRWGSVDIPLFGVHQISNILAATAAAKAVGMKESEIQQALKLIRPLPHTMRPANGINGSIFVDDTFNNNPDAAIAAIDFLATAKGKKILVFQPMIELGSYATESHKRVANYASKICDEIILTNDSFSELFTARVMSPRQAADHLKKTVSRGDTVLFKGKEAGRVLQLLV